MTNNKSDVIETSVGVEALIEKLRSDGVDQGKAEAQRLVKDAQSRADWILEQAHEEAEKLRASALREMEEMRHGALEALRIAARDTALGLQDELISSFNSQVERLVAESLQDKAAIERLLQVLLAQLCRNSDIQLGREVEILMPLDVTPSEEEFNQLLFSLSREVFTEGVNIQLGAKQQMGFSLRLKDKGMEVDMSKSSLSELLLDHLQPKFRDLLQGVFH